MTFFGPDLRNGLPIGLGSVAGFGIAPQFSPASLFLGGTVNGAWYDPSDSTTLFSDRAGTTPCGTPGGGSVVPVGLMLDKSQGLVLGPDVVVNGDFASGASWTPQAGWAISGGAANATASSSLIYQSNAGILVNRYYEVTFTVSNYVAGSVRPYLGATPTYGSFVSANGTYTQRFSPTVNGNELGFGASGFTGSIDNVSIKQVSGNHAIAANDTTARPELRARVNLLTYSEQFDNAAWGKTNTTITQNAVANPLTGTANADALFETNANGAHYITQGPTTEAIRYTYSVYVKSNGRSRIAIAGTSSYGGNLGNGVFFDIGSGAYISGAASGAVPSITNAGDGWFLVSYTWTANAFGGGDLGVYLVNSGTNTSYAGDVTKGIYIWGADIRPANIGTVMPAYQRISDANTYDAVGFPRYLAFNGTSSAMSTPGNVNLSGTDKATVFAGVRKLSDGASGNNAVLLETNIALIPNRYAIFAPANAASADRSYWFLAGGSAENYAAWNLALYPAPISNVLSCSMSTVSTLGVGAVVPRINGAQVTPSIATTNTSTGNFPSSVLNIGARGNGSSLFLNGNIYSLIVVGSAVSAGQISATEQWVAQRTGITL